MKTWRCNNALFLCCVLFAYQALVKGKSVKPDITCRIVLIHEVRKAEHSSRYECDRISEDGHVDGSFSIRLPADLVERNEDALKAGNWFLQIFGATIGEKTIEGYGQLATHIELTSSSQFKTILPNEGLATLHIRHRRLSLTTGVRDVVILRVAVNDAVPKYNASQLVQYFFDPYNYSVRTHYSDCSAGAITFQSYNTSNPVTEIFVNGSINKFTKDQLYQAATNAAIAKFGFHPNKLADHVAYILPSGTKDAYWFGFGGVKDWRIVFNNTIGGIVNTVIHELGHNIGLQHAGENGDQYADLTSIMGYGKFKQFGPSKCFSGFNYWYLGWFANRRLEVIPTNQSQSVQLAAFVDYFNTTSTQNVILKVGNYYLVYNRAKSFNIGTESHQNKVTVVTGYPTSPSSLLAALDNSTNTSSFVVPKYGGKNQNLTIAVCQIVSGGGGSVDYVSLSISLGQPIVCTTTRLRGKRSF